MRQLSKRITKSQQGITLMELLITISIGAILLTLAAPSFNALVHNGQMMLQTDALVKAFHLARSESIKRGVPVAIKNRTGSDWSDGWVVWIDKNLDGNFSTSEALRYWDGTNGGQKVIALSSTLNFQYQPSGEIDKSDSFQICNTSINPEGRQIDIALLGRIRTQTIECS